MELFPFFLLLEPKTNKPKRKKQMKKLMMAMVAAAMVGAANAEASHTFTAYNLDAKYNGYKITWMVSQGGNDDEPVENLDSDAIFFMNDGLLSDSALEDSGAKSWTEYYQTASSWYPQGEVVGGSGSVQFLDDDESYSQYSIVFALFENGITAGSKYALLETVYYDGVSTYNPTFDMTGAKVIQSGTLNIPEPTSGLLMLLGMAGLALKRKRA